MRDVLQNPWRAGGIGAALAAAVLLIAGMRAGVGGDVMAAMAVRVLHVLAAGVWTGLIFFVNLVQLAALSAASDGERPAIVRHIVPGVARVFTGAAHLTLLTGLLLLVPLHRALAGRPLLIAAVLGGLAMWAIVEFVLRPNVGRVTGRIAASDEEKAAARSAIARWARVNLLLVLPVTAAMVAAAHWGA